MIPFQHLDKALFLSIILALVGVAGYQRMELANIGKQVATERAQNDILQSQIQQQNAAVEQLERDSEELEARVRRATEGGPMPRPRVLESVTGPVEGETFCERLFNLDRRFIEALTK